ncbi:MAG: rod-binding protein [Abditibacteriales bacterium]|nr:rod-binding protein [Abditibacteriales bacterium]MDW8364569.1 rod-binding protein [Abditibacteriales bacterium]
MGALNALLAVFPASSLNGVERVVQHQTDELRKATQDFEAIFVAQLLSQMRKAMAPPSSLLGGGREEETFREWMDQEIGKSVARRGGLGIGEAVYRQLLKNAVHFAENVNAKRDAGLLKG